MGEAPPRLPSKAKPGELIKSEEWNLIIDWLDYFKQQLKPVMLKEVIKVSYEIIAPPPPQTLTLTQDLVKALYVSFEIIPPVSPIAKSVTIDKFPSITYIVTPPVSPKVLTITYSPWPSISFTTKGGIKEVLTLTIPKPTESVSYEVT